jgi:hypothetical protein
MATWMDRVLAAVGMGNRKTEADVSFEPAQAGRGQDDSTVGADPSPEFHGLPDDKPSGQADGPAKEPGGP